jgi:hypothetical protein
MNLALTKNEALLFAIDVRFGSLADIATLNWDVRFTPDNGHSTARRGHVQNSCTVHSPMKIHSAIQKAGNNRLRRW